MIDEKQNYLYQTTVSINFRFIFAFYDKRTFLTEWTHSLWVNQHAKVCSRWLVHKHFYAWEKYYLTTSTSTIKLSDDQA
jgi:hypothetical protein